MRTEFYYNKRKYTCGIFKTELVNELRIRSEQGEILAIEQGKRIGLRGKKREDSRQVDVSQPYFYNLIKAAVSALEIAEMNQLLLEKDRVVDVKDKQINILNQQLNILNKTHILSIEQAQNFAQLQFAMKEQVAVIEEQKQRIENLENELIHLPQTISLDKIKEKIRAKLGNSIWSCLHPSSQRELCDAYRNYLLVKSDEFTADVADYSGAGHPLSIVAEREIVAPFFKELYQFLSVNNKKADASASITFEVGGIILKLKGKYTLGDLPALISIQWETFIDNVLQQEDIFTDNNLYRTAFCGDKISKTDRQILEQFLQQWQHPLAKWFAKGQSTASKIDQIRKLRNRVTHAEPVYKWHFKILWTLIVGGKTSLGLLQEIYEESNQKQLPPRCQERQVGGYFLMS